MPGSGGEHQRRVVYKRRVAADGSGGGRRWRGVPLLDASTISVCWQSRCLGTAVSRDRRTLLPSTTVLSGDLCDIWGLLAVFH